MNKLLSIVICTHNPRVDYFNKVLLALVDQTLTKDLWELVVIDNASQPALVQHSDLNLPEFCRVIVESQLGLTPARLRGIREAKTETIIFVDDDNVLDADYLEVSLKISQNFPFLGAWGGQIRAEFEVQPIAWTKPHLPYLTIREFDKDQWSNQYQNSIVPYGAGLCVRQTVAKRYATLAEHNPIRQCLDRKGSGQKNEILLSCGDVDLAFTACDIGLGIGLFTALKLTHLISSRRLQPNYLLKLIEGTTYSEIILKSLRGISVPTKLSWHRKLREYYRLMRMSPEDRRVNQVIQRATDLAIQEVSRLQHQSIAHPTQTYQNDSTALP
ncbi:glycosyltransferase [Phormidesmis sp. 146-12]